MFILNMSIPNFLNNRNIIEIRILGSKKENFNRKAPSDRLDFLWQLYSNENDELQSLPVINIRLISFPSNYYILFTDFRIESGSDL